MVFKKMNVVKFSLSLSVGLLSACGGGGTESGGAPTISAKCNVSSVQVSSGSSATLSKAADSLSVDFSLDLQENVSITTSSNFENNNADDWIEGVPINRALAAGNHAIRIVYDLNSPKKTTADRYTKLSISVLLPNNESCVSNQTVNISLIP